MTAMDASAGTAQPKYFLSLVAPLKDEDPYLVEFVNYYLVQGVDHFYFYDNESRVPVVDVLARYRDVCTVMRATGDAVQRRVYAHFRERFRRETKWVAVFDADEFVLPHRHDSLREFLRDYDHCDGIGINWVMFGDGHHRTPPAGGVIANYLYREANQHPCIKSVVKGEKLVGFFHNPHFATLAEGSVYVDAHMNALTSPFNANPTTDVIQLNHYFTKSEAEWKRKLLRKRADSGRPLAEHNEAHDGGLSINETANQVRDTTIVDRFGARLAESMRLRGA
jgi:hypothetical protein